MELIRSYGSIHVGLPQITDGSAPALTVSRPAQRSLTLQPADSPSRLMRPSTPEAPAALLPPPPLRLLPGGAIQFPGGSFVPLWTSAFSRRTVIACLRQLSDMRLFWKSTDQKERLLFGEFERVQHTL
jgi:hypothetical protein